MKSQAELQELYKECLEFWGFEKQARMAQEECAELIVAISHVLKGRENSMESMIEECADVYLTLNQMIAYVGEEAVMDVVDFKFDRVKAKLKRYKAEEVNGNLRT